MTPIISPFGNICTPYYLTTYINGPKLLLLVLSHIMIWYMNDPKLLLRCVSPSDTASEWRDEPAKAIRHIQYTYRLTRKEKLRKPFRAIRVPCFCPWSRNGPTKCYPDLPTLIFVCEYVAILFDLRGHRGQHFIVLFYQTIYIYSFIIPLVL